MNVKFLVFFSEDCSYCKKMDTMIDEDTTVKIDVNEFPEIADAFGVKFLPTILKISGSVEGYDYDKIKNLIGK